MLINKCIQQASPEISLNIEKNMKTRDGEHYFRIENLFKQNERE